MCTVYVCGFLYLTISVLEDDAHHVSLKWGVLVQQPQRLHLGVHKSALICTATENTHYEYMDNLIVCQVHRLKTKWTWKFRKCDGNVSLLISLTVHHIRIYTEISWQLLVTSLWDFAHTFVVHREWLVTTLTSWLFILHHHQVKICQIVWFMTKHLQHSWHSH